MQLTEDESWIGKSFSKETDLVFLKTEQTTTNKQKFLTWKTLSGTLKIIIIRTYDLYETSRVSIKVLGENCIQLSWFKGL